MIIGFNSSPGAAENALIDGVGGTVNGRFSIISAVTATVPTNAIKGLQSNPNVAYVEEDGFKELHTNSAVGELQWGVNRIDADAAWAGNIGAGLVDAENAVLGTTAGNDLPGGGGPAPTPTPAPDPTPTPVPGGGAVYHSSDISTVAPKKGSWYRLAATITVRADDESLAPEGATVTGRITRDGNSFSYAQTVDANGQVSFNLRTQLEGTTYTVVVDSVNDGGGSSFDTLRECATRTVTIGAAQGDCAPGASH